ncbi:sulphur oxidation protein SoxZ [Methylocella silvestris BL2]|uniref:Sulphur oxidation protein SoxZ n=1 Tax=Methylocella silvestris (strain DSM 15510 / CIP 108128 / LMG 27833 / NCIMB 13906 / BL2) TaxID=395965 RepID=B8EMG4_METSB|nr:quinoprotein dehydrogenase-associated SoxYZ-like carrier [Methylocella silvestris]ACK52092.1 sulphur oxidation protein SoxZ [Methylocella silvestris BL2]
MRTSFALKAALSLGVVFAALTAAPFVAPSARAAAGDDPAQREARWQDIAKTMFQDRARQNGEAIISLDAPQRALDASLVPMTVTLSDKIPMKGMYLIIDDNPSPVAAHFTFGPAADPHQINLRVRINSYTNVHAIAEAADGTLYETVQFVKAAGGCSAPMGMSDEEAMKGMGEIRLKLADESSDKPARATLMVRHPNFNGMQMNQVTRDYTPARYIQTISVTSGDNKVFDLETDISLASNPVIGFGLKPRGEIKVAVTDSEKDHWEKSFAASHLSN